MSCKPDLFILPPFSPFLFPLPPLLTLTPLFLPLPPFLLPLLLPEFPSSNFHQFPFIKTFIPLPYQAYTPLVLPAPLIISCTFTTSSLTPLHLHYLFHMCVIFISPPCPFFSLIHISKSLNSIVGKENFWKNKKQ